MRILIATDFSAGGDAAVRAGAMAARLAGADVVLCTALQAPSEACQQMLQEPPLDVAVESRAAARLLRITAQRCGLAARCEMLVLNGRPAVEVPRAAERSHCDLVVVGALGRSGGGRWRLGSVAESILRYSLVPVLVVPPNMRQQR